MKSIYFAIPAYNGVVSVRTMATFVSALTSLGEDARIHWPMCERALLVDVNSMWADAVNTHVPQGCEWFVMLHADMGSPRATWLPELLAAADAQGLDAISAVAAIKDGSGDTSCALFDDEGGHRRVSIAEMRGWPEVATAAWCREKFGRVLAMNSGMLALRVSRPWAAEFSFRFENFVTREEGRLRAGQMSEDWLMSRQLHEWGVPYGVHTGIPTTHSGGTVWEWGR